MKNKGLCLIIAGTMLVLSALFLVFYNFRQDNRSGEKASEILSEIKEIIPETTVQTSSPEFITSSDSNNNLFEEYEEYETTTVPEEKLVEIDSNYYIGIINIPSLGIELPILSEWSYPNLKLSPCRYKGSIDGGDLIIAAHNYRSHFGRISELNSGDSIIIIDGNGISHEYEVIQSELIDGYNIESMEFGSADNWDLTLFTCTLSGQSRVTVRAIKVK